MAHATTTHAPSEKYYVPHSSPWPLVGSMVLYDSRDRRAAGRAAEPGPEATPEGLA